MTAAILDQDEIRARVQRQLAPQLRMRRQRLLAFAHFVTFVIVNAVFYSYGALVFDVEQTLHPTYDPVLNGFMVPAVPVVFIISLFWLALLVVHIISFFARSGRERLIARATNHELELEKLRLQADIARHSDASDASTEKVKRKARLSDDGELIYEDEATQQMPVQLVQNSAVSSGNST